MQAYLKNSMIVALTKIRSLQQVQKINYINLDGSGIVHGA